MNMSLFVKHPNAARSSFAILFFLVTLFCRRDKRARRGQRFAMSAPSGSSDPALHSSDGSLLWSSTVRYSRTGPPHSRGEVDMSRSTAVSSATGAMRSAARARGRPSASPTKCPRPTSVAITRASFVHHSWRRRGHLRHSGIALTTTCRENVRAAVSRRPGPPSSPQNCMRVRRALTGDLTQLPAN